GDLGVPLRPRHALSRLRLPVHANAGPGRPLINDGQGEELLEPVAPLGSPAVNGRWTVATTDQGTDGDDHDVHKQVLAVAEVSGVGKGLEVRTDRLDIHPFGDHARYPGDTG